ncbi:MAG: ParA family protein [Bacteroidia bacterium]|nr:ParA family protein [Bacteroidia bacterium]
MATIISFISRKGGTGKTTNAINLATTLSGMGKRVLLVETDTNYTLNTLRKMEMFKGDNGAPPFEILGSQDSEVADELMRIKGKSESTLLWWTAREKPPTRASRNFVW